MKKDDKTISIKNEEEYGEVISYLGGIAFGSMHTLVNSSNMKTYYINKEGDQIVKVDNKKKRIDLSDTVEQNILDKLKRIVNSKN